MHGLVTAFPSKVNSQSIYLYYEVYRSLEFPLFIESVDWSYWLPIPEKKGFYIVHGEFLEALQFRYVIKDKIAVYGAGNK